MRDLGRAFDAATLQRLQEKDLIRQKIDPKTGRLIWYAVASFSILSNGDIIKHGQDARIVYA